MNNLYFSHIIPNFIGADRMEQLPIRKGSLTTLPHLFCISQDNILKQGKMKRLSFEELPEVNSERWNSLEPLEGEEWRDVKGYEGIYKVSDYGRVMRLSQINTYRDGSVHKEHTRIVNTYPIRGYMHVTLSYKKNNKNSFVHRLVGDAFLYKENDTLQINHKNEIKRDNRVENLEWCTALYNVTYGTRLKRLGDKKARAVNVYTLDGQLLGTFRSATEAGEQYGVHQAGVSRVCLKKVSSENGYVFRYCDDVEGNKKGNIITIDPKVRTAKKLMKKVILYNENGEFVKEYESVNEAARMTHSIRRSVILWSKSGEVKKGYIWKMLERNCSDYAKVISR